MFLSLFLISLIIGGVDQSYSQDSQTKYTYKLVVENNKSKVITNIYVYAYSEENAKSEVELNGWTVIFIDKIEDGLIDSEYLVEDNTDLLKTYVLPDKIVIRSPIEDFIIEDETPTGDEIDILVNGTLLPDNTTDDNGTGKSKDNSSYLNELYDGPMIDPFANSVLDNNSLKSDGSDFASINNFTPTSDNLNLVSKSFNDLGIIKPNGIIEGIDIKKLDKDKQYVIFGFSDDVPVTSNLRYRNNFELSLKRSKFIYDKLLSLGFKSENLKFYGLGTMYPVVKSEGNLSDLEPMPENRRVEIYEYRRDK